MKKLAIRILMRALVRLGAVKIVTGNHRVSRSVLVQSYLPQAVITGARLDTRRKVAEAVFPYVTVEKTEDMESGDVLLRATAAVIARE